MNKQLATILKGKLQSLPFVDLLCGMVQTLTTDEPASESQVVQKRTPVTYDHNDETCAGAEIRPIPEDRRKSIIYFEDFGISVVDKVHGMTKYNSSLRLICWMNRARLVGNQYQDISGNVMAAIIEKIANLGPQNTGIFTRLSTKVARIPPQDAALFNRYTYTETDRQYLRPPFEFFGIDFSCDYFVHPKCLDTLPWGQTICY